ncbi:UvrD-helicase domain-containing protein [Rubritalea marina]|uniref:UvrD-helicase domain-containing protein n=1 Tax=Rubritalea marina TaxID=361055 RepID=UPI000361FD91|nr:UvrD-helicase domain-containing protein [Rubritalea marina]
MFSSLIIEASAGSGKTYQLSNRFIALLALGEAPEDLIALTFTRKAAGEFTRRILNRLAVGASSPEEAASLAEELLPTLQGEAASKMPAITTQAHLPKLDMTAFRELLAKLIQALDRLQLSTLDSFFTRLVQCFGPELGLPGFEMLDEEAYDLAREDTLFEVLNGSGLRARQRSHFLSAFAVANYGNEESRVRDSIIQFIQEHHERYLQNGRFEAWGNGPALWHDFEDWPTHTPEAFTALAQVISEESEADFGHKSMNKALRNIAHASTQYSPGTPLPKELAGNLSKWTDGAQPGQIITVNYYKKDREFSLRLSNALLDLRDLIRIAEIEVFLKRTQGIWAVVSAFEAQYNKQCRSQGRVSFTDLTLLLQQHAVLARQTGFNELAYRLDSKFKHWLLDEFQDTSRRQWDVIEPVIDEAASDVEGERSLFLVGDTKQSIYGWRGGEPRLFNELRTKQDWLRLHNWTMSQSWRSSSTVLDFVNLIGDPEGVGIKQMPNAMRQRWNFEQHRAARQVQGEVRILQFQERRGEDLPARKSAFISEMKRLNPIARGLSCAVLVSSNKQVQEYTGLLREHTDLAVEAEAAVGIATDSPMGLAILDWFRYLVSPGDQFARRHIECSPLSESINLFGEHPSAQWTQACSEISSEGVTTHLQKLMGQLPETFHLGDFQEHRLESIFHCARGFDERGGSLEEWLRVIENKQQREASAEGAIQIMTVHKSKGLEFDMVFLPELGASNYDDMRRMGILTEEDTEHQPSHFMLTPSKGVIMSDAVLSKQYQDWVADNCFERACNLYVSLTRAARALYIFLPPPSSTKNPLNDAEWIRNTVGDIEAEDAHFENEVVGQEIYHRGTPHWLEAFPPKSTQLELVTHKIQLPSATPRQGRRTASSEKSQFFVKRKSRASRGGKEFGNEVHALFEGIAELKQHPTLPNNEAGRAVAACLKLPESAQWFDSQNHIETLREQAVEAIDANGVWFSGIIDRVRIHRDLNGKVTQVQILDYKTDSVDSAAHLTERYHSQLTSYATAIAEIYQIPTSQVSCHILSTKLKQYIPVC